MNDYWYLWCESFYDKAWAIKAWQEYIDREDDRRHILDVMRGRG